MIEEIKENNEKEKTIKNGAAAKDFVAAPRLFYSLSAALSQFRRKM